MRPHFRSCVEERAQPGHKALAFLEIAAHATGKTGTNKVVRAGLIDDGESGVDRVVGAPKNPGWKDQMRDSESDIYSLTKSAYNRPRSNAKPRLEFKYYAQNYSPRPMLRDKKPMQRLRSNATEFRNAGGDKRTAADETFIKLHDNHLVKQKAASTHRSKIQP